MGTSFSQVPKTKVEKFNQFFFACVKLAIVSVRFPLFIYGIFLGIFFSDSAIAQTTWSGYLPIVRAQTDNFIRNVQRRGNAYAGIFLLAKEIENRCEQLDNGMTTENVSQAKFHILFNLANIYSNTIRNGKRYFTDEDWLALSSSDKRAWEDCLKEATIEIHRAPNLLDATESDFRKRVLKASQWYVTDQFEKYMSPLVNPTDADIHAAMNDLFSAVINASNSSYLFLSQEFMADFKKKLLQEIGGRIFSDLDREMAFPRFWVRITRNSQSQNNDLPRKAEICLQAFESNLNNSALPLTGQESVFFRKCKDLIASGNALLGEVQP